MASTSGTKGIDQNAPRLPSRRLTRPPAREVELLDEEGATDSEIVPSSLAVIVPILRAANEIELENPRVAYLCECLSEYSGEDSFFMKILLCD